MPTGLGDVLTFSNILEQSVQNPYCIPATMSGSRSPSASTYHGALSHSDGMDSHQTKMNGADFLSLFAFDASADSDDIIIQRTNPGIRAYQIFFPPRAVSSEPQGPRPIIVSGRNYRGAPP